MIKSEELQRKNWVQIPNGDFRQVESIRPDKCSVLIRGCSIAQLHLGYDLIVPIEMTSKIALKAGFTKEGKYLVYQAPLDNMVYRLVEIERGSWVLSKGFLHWNSEISIIKYLHVLQNWIKLFTGEDLVIDWGMETVVNEIKPMVNVF